MLRLMRQLAPVAARSALAIRAPDVLTFTTTAIAVRNVRVMELLVSSRGLSVAAAPHKAVMLKVGEGRFSRLTQADALGMNSTALLKALCHDVMNATQLKDTELDKRIVEATARAADELDDAATWLPLKGDTTLGELWAQLKSAAPFLHVRVRPASAPAAAIALAEKEAWLCERWDTISEFDPTVIRRTDKCQHIVVELAKRLGAAAVPPA